MRISVIVPAKNEEAEIWSSLSALYHQVDPWEEPIDKSRYEVIVLANNCTDATARQARWFAREHPDLVLHVAEVHFPAECANIGYVRRTLMDEAYYRLLSIGKPRGVIASTDGDTVVSSTWIYHTLQAFEQGVDAVGGRILTTRRSDDYRLYHLQDVTYRYLQARLESMIDPNPADPWPRHFQNFGPSLAVSCAIYERAGRLPIVPYLEDVCFYEALQRCDARIRHCPGVRVITSSRTEGRVAFGFSKQLQEWKIMQRGRIPWMVPSAEEWELRFALQQQLRIAWQSKSYQQLAEVKQKTKAPLIPFYEVMLNSPYFGMFLQRVMGSDTMSAWMKQQFTPLPIGEAIVQLRNLIRRYESSVPPMVQETTAPPINPIDIALLADDGGVEVEG